LATRRSEAQRRWIRGFPHLSLDRDGFVIDLF